MTDVSRSLRDEERQAWQRLIRVIGHEINNSLAPIKSIANSLERLVAREPKPADWESDMRDGLQVIGGRADSLGRFTAAYAQLARLPAPTHRAGGAAGAGGRVSPASSADSRCASTAARTSTVQRRRRPAGAAADQPGAQRRGRRAGHRRRRVTSAGALADGRVRVWVDDEGPGVSNPANLFVPFFTTKPGGSGIGLVLCRQIAEAHGGTVTLDNRQPGPGCRAELVLPLE